ncbi:MAG: hypothetical protein NVS2B16_35880 [Chloroflexota bacterium]
MIVKPIDGYGVGSVGLAVTVSLDALTPNTGTIPCPFSITLCGERAALSVILKMADFAPADSGLKITLMLQLARMAIDEPQLFACEKSSAASPMTAMDFSLTAVGPALVTVTVLGWEAVVACWSAKDSVVTLSSKVEEADTMLVSAAAA